MYIGAQEEALVGTWISVLTLEAGVITTAITFNADGTVTQTATGEGNLDELLVAFAGEGGALGVPLGEGTFEIGLTGTWTVDGDVLTLHPPEVTELLVNGQEAEEFFLLLLDDTVDQLAAQQGLSEEEATALKALLALQAPQLIEDVKTDLAGDEDAVSTFSIDGDTLTLTFEEGAVQELVRVSASTVVKAHSWGQVKAFWR